MTQTCLAEPNDIQPIHYLFDRQQLLSNTKELYKRNYALKKQVKFMDARLGTLIQYYQEIKKPKMKRKNAEPVLISSFKNEVITDHMKQVNVHLNAFYKIGIRKLYFKFTNPSLSLSFIFKSFGIG